MDSSCWLDHQKLSRYSNRLLLGIIPKEKEEKSNKVFISGSQMKRIPYRCHKVLQEHNCFWALICFSAATKGGKGVIVVNVSVHSPFCTPRGSPTWNTREKRVYKRKGDNKLSSNIISWKKNLSQPVCAVTDKHLGSVFSMGVKFSRQAGFPLRSTPLIPQNLSTSEKFGLWNTNVMPGSNFACPSQFNIYFFVYPTTITMITTMNSLFVFPSLTSDHLVFMRSSMWKTSFKKMCKQLT